MRNPFISLLFCISLYVAFQAHAHAATVAHWRFEGTDVTFFEDSSGNGHDLGFDDNTTVESATPYTLPTTGAGSAFLDPLPQSGLLNTGAANFTTSGVDGYLRAPDSSAWTTNTFTIEAMVNLTTVGALQSIAGQLSTIEAAKRTLLFHVNSGNKLAIIINNDTISSSLQLSGSVDYYVGVAVDLTAPENERLTFYLQDLTNGGALQSQTLDTDSTNILDNISPFSIGSTSSPSSRFNGLIDEVRFSDTALEASELLIAPEPARAMFLCLGLMLASLRRKRSR